MDNAYQKIHYKDVRQINYLNDIKNGGQQASKDHLKFNSDSEAIDSIAQKLYKKIVRQGYIQKPNHFAALQAKKKNQTKYDLSDKFIDDQEVFTQAQNQKKASQFSKFKSISDISIEQFYKTAVQTKMKETSRSPKTSQFGNMFKNPLTVIKFGELKKKIQSNISADNKIREQIVKKLKQDKSN